MVVLIGLCGKKGSGKSTLASYLVKEKGFVEFSLAKNLKDICELAFNIPPELSLSTATQEQKEAILPEWNVSAREIWQILGTDIFRDALKEKLPNLDLNGTTFWIKKFEMWLKTIPDDTKVVVSDVRFADEVEAIHKYGGVVYKIIRDHPLTDYHDEKDDDQEDEGEQKHDDDEDETDEDEDQQEEEEEDDEQESEHEQDDEQESEQEQDDEQESEQQVHHYDQWDPHPSYDDFQTNLFANWMKLALIIVIASIAFTVMDFSVPHFYIISFVILMIALIKRITDDFHHLEDFDEKRNTFSFTTTTITPSKTTNTTSTTQHASEMQNLDADFILFNHGSVQDLFDNFSEHY